MSRYSATTLDLSRLPPPKATELLDENRILDARIVRLKQLFAARGIDWDVERTAHDPAVIISLNDTLREMLVAGAINDAVKAEMLTFAVGADLDQLAANLGVQRTVITPASGLTPAVLESDADLRARLLIAMEATAAAGPRGAYEFHARTAAPQVRAVDVWSPAPGEVAIAVQSRLGDGAPTPELVEAVRAHIVQDHIKPLTDMVQVRPVENVYFSLLVTGFIQPGPDPVTVRASMAASLAAMVEGRRLPGRDIPNSAVISAAMIGPVDRVVTGHADLVIGHGQVAVCTDITVVVETHDG